MLTTTQAENHLEKVMRGLSANLNENSFYLAGMIDAFFELGQIEEATREKLYLDYVAFEQEVNQKELIIKDLTESEPVLERARG